VVRTEEGNLFAGDNTPMLPLSSKTRVNPSNLVTNADIAHLRRKVEQMEQNLQKKELQLQAADEKAQQIMQLNVKLEKLERQIQLKDEAHRKLEFQLYERQV
jgi:predicted RNase H-like nuclease (RuvC/YqgF family)